MAHSFVLAHRAVAAASHRVAHFHALGHLPCPNPHRRPIRARALAVNPIGRALDKPTHAIDHCPSSRPVPAQLLEPSCPLLHWPASATAVAATTPPHWLPLQHAPCPRADKAQGTKRPPGARPLHVVAYSPLTPTVQHAYLMPWTSCPTSLSADAFLQ
jgi:hypothetical protein